MVTITLPDSTTRQFDGAVSGADIATDIGPGLAKAALAIVVDDVPRDLSFVIEQDAKVSIVTGKDALGLEVIRHDTAHILAEAVKELYPETQVTIGPAIENGFYYDFARKTPFSTDDLTKIEAKMAEIIARNEPIVREIWERDDAVRFFTEIGEAYKAEIIAGIDASEEISMYRQGAFMDLCAGPHAPSTGKPKAFKLMKVAGAYWRGDSDNEMLQRIYGTAWPDQKQLKAYLHRLEEAEKRDHRKLGKGLGLFHLQEEAVGQIFWHDKGWTLYRIVENYIRDIRRKQGYSEVKTPAMIDRALWEKSGHWEKFREQMFTAESEDRTLAVKPMNCPAHVQIFNQGIKSYRDLPLRMSEFGSCCRNEPSGALHGLMRLRAFVQDDSHLFCTEAQIISETKSFCDMLLAVYKHFGFEKVDVKVATRPDTRAGTDDTWDKAEAALIEATEAAGLEYEITPGEGAFYGPKIEFHLTDCLGRSWQCGTLQVDFVMPERLGAHYVGEDGNKHHPVMLHCAILGSLERFIGILIEEHAGKFPLWLAPTQIVVATVTDASSVYAEEVQKQCEESGLRVISDLRNEKISYKVREHSHQKIPVIMAVGEREAQERTVSIRRIGSKAQVVLPLDQAIASLLEEAA